MKLLRKAGKWMAGLYRAYRHTGGFHHEEKMLVQRHYSTSHPQKGIRKQTVIAMADGRILHGGLSDRIRGMVSVYGYCKAHDIPFRLHYVSPFQLTDYLVPASYDWRISQEEISYHPEEAVPILLTCDRLPNKHHLRYLKQILKKHPNRQIHLYTNTQFADKDFQKNFSELFRPVPALQERIEQAIAPGQGDFISMTFRFQQLLGDFKEEGCKTLPPAEQETLISRCIGKVKEIHDQRHPNQRILATSDSITFLERLQQELPYVFTIPGEVVHIDYTPEASYETYLKPFLDQFALSKAKKVYLLRTGEMYRSGFGKRAAKMSGIPFEDIAF